MDVLKCPVVFGTDTQLVVGYRASISKMSNQILIWGIWRLGCYLGIFVVFVEPLLSHFRCAAGHNILPGSPLLWRSAVAAEMYSQCAKTFRWDVCVKVTSTWMQGHCVIYITCHKFTLFWPITISGAVCAEIIQTTFTCFMLQYYSYIIQIHFHPHYYAFNTP